MADTLEDALSDGATVIDDTLVIDNNLRTITIPSSVTLLGVESDDNVNTLKFKMPKTYNGIDLSTFEVHINFRNANGDLGLYIVQDATVDGDNIKFSWVVGRQACAYNGTTRFIVCLCKYSDWYDKTVTTTDENGDTIETKTKTRDVTKEFNTAIASLTVLAGIEPSTDVTVEADVTEQLLTKLEAKTNEIIEAARVAAQNVGATTVVVTPNLTSGTAVGTITVNGESKTLYAPSHSYQVKALVNDGTPIGTISIDGNEVIIYAPQGAVNVSELTNDANYITSDSLELQFITSELTAGRSGVIYVYLTEWKNMSSSSLTGSATVTDNENSATEEAEINQENLTTYMNNGYHYRILTWSDTLGSAVTIFDTSIPQEMMDYHRESLSSMGNSLVQQIERKLEVTFVTKLPNTAHSVGLYVLLTDWDSVFTTTTAISESSLATYFSNSKTTYSVYIWSNSYDKFLQIKGESSGGMVSPITVSSYISNIYGTDDETKDKIYVVTAL